MNSEHTSTPQRNQEKKVKFCSGQDDVKQPCSRRVQAALAAKSLRRKRWASIAHGAGLSHFAQIDFIALLGSTLRLQGFKISVFHPDSQFFCSTSR